MCVKGTRLDHSHPVEHVYFPVSFLLLFCFKRRQSCFPYLLHSTYIFLKIRWEIVGTPTRHPCLLPRLPPRTYATSTTSLLTPPSSPDQRQARPVPALLALALFKISSTPPPRPRLPSSSYDSSFSFYCFIVTVYKGTVRPSSPPAPPFSLPLVPVLPIPLTVFAMSLNRVSSLETFAPLLTENRSRRSSDASTRARKISFNPLPPSWDPPALEQIQAVGAFEVPRWKRTRMSSVPPNLSKHVILTICLFFFSI